MQAEALGNQEELKDQNAILIAIDHVNKMLEEGGRPPKKFSAMAYRKGTPEFNEAMKFMKGSQDTGPDFKEEDVTRIVVLKYAETDKSGKTVVEGIDVALNDELEVKGTAD